MGQEQHIPAKKPSMEDNIIEMRMQSKALGRAAKKAEKQSAVYQKKAKQALKKNNQQAAKMYLMSAASKTKQAQNCQRTSIKMQIMMGQIKSMKNNEKFMNSFSALTQAASSQMNNFDAATMANQMQVFNNRMDQLMINNKMINELMDTNQPQTDAVVDQMKQALQQQILMEQKNKLIQQQRVKYQKQKAQSDKFLDELKDL